MPPISLKIGNRTIGKNQPVFVIAEAGVNHNGRLDLAKKLVDAAATAGADAIKFQTFKAEQVVTGAGKMAGYQKKNLGKSGSQLQMLKKLELREKDYPELIRYAKKKGLIFLSTPHGGFESVDFLNALGVSAFKFGSGDLTNFPILAHAAIYKKPMILGTGMATLKEIKEAIDCIKNSGNNKIIILHCTTDYPCAPEEVNLNVMRTLEDKLGVLTGYSDHTLGSQVPVMAAALGVCLIEKHLTLDKKMSGPDHEASSSPEEFLEMVNGIRVAEKILGSHKKAPTKSELQYIPTVRKSLVAARPIKKGERFTAENLAIKRPGTGLAPKHYFKVIGARARADIQADTLLEPRHYES
ncbi:MAG: N-acetylneuraminate synthase [bacterium]|nr:N-acetylneuraminate synthase [bacterium]